MHVKFARHVCKHTSCAWQVLQFSALVDLFDWPKLLCHRDLAVKDGCTSTAHWLQWFPPQLGADALGIGVSQLSYPNGVHMVFCAQANAGIDPGISPVPLVLPVLLSRLVWSLKLSLMTKVYVTFLGWAFDDIWSHALCVFYHVGVIALQAPSAHPSTKRLAWRGQLRFVLWPSMEIPWCDGT